MSLDAYQQTQVKSESAQETEYRLFTEVTRSLIAARDRGQKDKAYFEALDWNRRMWSVFSTDCAVPGNGLPDQLRASIISLSIWVSKHSSLVARGEEEMEPLIDINKTVMEGLALQVQARRAQPPAAPAPAPAQRSGYANTNTPQERSAARPDIGASNSSSAGFSVPRYISDV